MENQFQVYMAKSPVTDIYYNMKFRKSRLICISIRIDMFGSYGISIRTLVY